MPGLTPQQRSTLVREGAFQGLKTLKASRTITDEQVKEVTVGVFKAILAEVAEARKELAHLQRALTAMENSARTCVRNPTGPMGDAAYVQMTEHLITFDAWVASLLETDLTITGLLAPTHTRMKISRLATAMNALMDKRAAELHPVMDDPSLFKDYVDR